MANPLTALTQRIIVGPKHLAVPNFQGANKEFAAIMGTAKATPGGRHVAPQRSGILPMDVRAADPDALRGAAEAANKRVTASALASVDQIRARNALADIVEQPISFGRPKIDADLIAIGNGSNMHPTPHQIARLSRAFAEG
ncbi:MAG: hypothetical protein JWM90_2583 [Thermoleophilia bacterium]|nr:hypothetical protein [Thermoleophilia bacterium]